MNINDSRILVHFRPSRNTLKSKKIKVTSEMTFNDFRLRCCDLFEADILSMYTKDNKRISDIADLKSQSEIFVYDCFYPRWHCEVSTVSSMGNSVTSPLLHHSLEYFDKKYTTLKVEIIGPPKAGKTSFIFQFMKNDLVDSDSVSTTEAVFEKDIELQYTIVHFSITDYKETNNLKNFEERIADKDVLIFCAPKPEFEYYKDGMDRLLQKASKSNPLAFLVVLITKSDLKDDKSKITDETIAFKLNPKIYFTSIYHYDMSSKIKSSEEVFKSIADNMESKLLGLPLQKSTFSNISRNAQPVSTSDQNRGLWFLKPAFGFTSCFTHNNK